MQRQGGLRAVAVYEAAKGILVLAVGLGLLELIHRDLQQIAEHIAKHLHLNPSAHYPRVFLGVASKLNDARLWALAGGAVAYSGLRLIEAVGLWKGRRWAEWLGALSGGIYIPVEIYEAARKATATRLFLLIFNVAMVAYLVWDLWQQRRLRGPAAGGGVTTAR
ncbi:MAG TPA: DUF2127 domain-containing protein [Polyangia bacterium]|jgi:uncharacterized membrane protein (DUF2068 family)|nr:DUF2127 domain-containing protein [Polyangia bacterium]